MRLYLIRHGESENNSTGRWTGWADVGLTEKGIEDAKRVRKYISDVEFDKIYSSDLIRAKKTAEIAIPGCTYEETPILREINLGDLGGKKIADCQKIFGEDFKNNAAVQNYKPYNGENRAEFIARIMKFLDMVTKSGLENTAAFCHGGVLRRLRDIILQTELPRSAMPCFNCAILILEYKNENWFIHSWINTQ